MSNMDSMWTLSTLYIEMLTEVLVLDFVEAIMLGYKVMFVLKLEVVFVGLPKSNRSLIGYYYITSK